MNTANIKRYAPKARTGFIQAVSKRLNQFGIYTDKAGELTISEPLISGSVMQIDGNSFNANLATLRQKLVQRVTTEGFNQLVEHTAYTWFNRFCAIRYMELHDYLDHGLRVLSHPGKANSIEILDHAQEVAEDLNLNRDHIIELKLAGDKEEQLYRELLLGQCHKLHQAMPFLFEKIDDETELLLPDNLTRTDSILRGLVNEIPAEDWEQVEIIGWLYQFYISDKKDQVIGKVVKSEDIPAATQLFTPNWIVKYMVQNSLGRHWLNHYPQSPLKNNMDYYVDSAAHNAPLAINNSNEALNPEHITLIDPACGSGHILVEAYDLLKAIYEERGYRLRDIPQLILENNLYGLDIDNRAAQLSGFALMMKARADDRRIFTRNVQMNVLAIQTSKNLKIEQLWQQLNLNKQSKTGTNNQLFAEAQTDLETAVDDVQYNTLKNTLDLFEQAETLGSLIQIPAELADPLKALAEQLKTLAEEGDSLQKPGAKTVLPFIQQAEILAQRYDAVVANPPYMGSKYQIPAVKKHLKEHFNGYEKDLFSAFIVRNLQLAKEQGQLGFMTPFVWMFISSYEKLRAKLIDEATITTLIQLEYSGFDGATVPICTFTLAANHIKDYVGGYIKLSDFKGHKNQAPKTLEAIKNPDCGWFHYAKPDDFKKIPGSPIAYWVSDTVRNVFEKEESLKNFAPTKQGLATGENDKFLRIWSEVSLNKLRISTDYDRYDLKWFPCNKGGAFRKWYGNNIYVVNWQNSGEEIRSFKDENGKLRSRPQNIPYYFKEGLTWSALSSSSLSMRYSPETNMFETKGAMCFPISQDYLFSVLAYANSKLVNHFLLATSPTLDYHEGPVGNLPFVHIDDSIKICRKLIEIYRDDWNSVEFSWEFKKSPIDITGKSLKDFFNNYSAICKSKLAKVIDLEERNNRLFIDAYGLQDELTPDVPLEQITLTVNPKYRYGGKLSDEALESRFQSDTLAELISYAIGCMMGRYSLDKAGLVYAHSGNVDFDTIYRSHAPRGNAALNAPHSKTENDETENHANAQDDTVENYHKEQMETRAHAAHESDSVRGTNDIKIPTFAPDDDGIIPLTDQEWFEDDVTLRFRDFIRAAFADPANLNNDKLQSNLDFIAQSLCLHALKPKSGESSLDTIRRYLSTQFYKDHLKTYKKRPIYWLFSSGKQKAFECLVYLHRYNESTLARMRTEYVSPLLGKYEAYADTLKQQIEQASSTAETNRHRKSQTALEKKQTELREFDDKLKHYADMQIKLDLDDGVKVNYSKFGDLLVDVKAVTGKK